MTSTPDVPWAAFKWPVSASSAIAAPEERVWEVISAPGGLERYHPFCAENPVLAWPGSGSRDEIHYLSGWVFERRFLRWYEGVGYDLEIGRPGGRTSLVAWRISPVQELSCELSIVVCPFVLQTLPVALRWLPHILYLRPLLGKYLSSVVRGIEWSIVHDQPVPREHFGRHPWFSFTPS